MQTEIRFIFKVQAKDYRRVYQQEATIELLLEWLTSQGRKLQAQLHVQGLKAFVRKDLSHHPQYQYIKLQNKEFLEDYFTKLPSTITVEFFYDSRKQSIMTSLNRIGNDLQVRMPELKLMVNKLKDEAELLNAPLIICQTTRSFSGDGQQAIDIFIAVSDPLVRVKNSQLLPLYNQELDITSHIDRIKRASVSDSNLSIRIKREWATPKKLLSILNQEQSLRKRISIVQLLTEVRIINEKLMLSLQGELGEQVWESAQEVMSSNKVDLLIVIGVGANLLQNIEFPKPLILISTISIENKRTPTQNRVMDSQGIYKDAYSQSFLQNFYQNLFKRIEIEQSVQLAKGEASKQSADCIWCCCLHEHAPDCEWQQIVSKIGYMEAHRIFKHKQYKTNNFYQTTTRVQQILTDKNETCSNGNICCYGKFGVDKKVMHGQVGKLLYWNNKCSQLLYSDSHQKRLNRFESEQYDNASGRVRPLTVYKLLQAIVKKDQQVILVRATVLSEVKQYLSFTKEYLLTRDDSAYFCEYGTAKELGMRKYLRDVQTLFRSRIRLGSSIPKITLYVQLCYDSKNSDRHYFNLFQHEPDQLLSEANTLGLQIQRIKFIVLTSSPSLQDKYSTFKVEQPQKSELYHLHFSRHTYDYIKCNLRVLRQQIQKEQVFQDDEVESKCQDMKYGEETDFQFLGFISLFNEDGFYLSDFGRIVLDMLFGKEAIAKAINHQLPIEIINLSDCMYIQLHKAYQHYFLHKTNKDFRLHFQKLQLEFYYILFRTFYQIFAINEVQNSEGRLRVMAKKEGLFSIDIQEYSNTYDDRVNQCKQALSKESEQNSINHYNSFRRFYHLKQIEKFIAVFPARRRNQYVTTSKSYIRQSEPVEFDYLYWNVLHLTWKNLLFMNNQYIINKFQASLLRFLKQVQILKPFAEIARMQLYIMIGSLPPKMDVVDIKAKELPNNEGQNNNNGSLKQGSGLKKGSTIYGAISEFRGNMSKASLINKQMAGLFKSSKQMSQLLVWLRVYSIQQHRLSQVELVWGKLLNFQEDLTSSVRMAQKIIDMLLNAGGDFQEELREGMFRNFTVLQWQREILKVTEKKITYYFQLSKMLKLIHVRSEHARREKQFHKQFQLDNLVKDFKGQRAKLPNDQQCLKHRVLIDHYLKVITNETEVSANIIKQLKGGLSPQYLPIFDYLCQKIEQKTLFNQKGLIICARARTILAQGKPYIMSRKRNLTMHYLIKSVQKLKLKISYFTLNTNTLNNLKSDENNKHCEVLFLILAIDCPSPTQLNFGEDNGVSAETMHIRTFAEQIKSSRIRFLIICGKNSIKMCEQLTVLLRGWEFFPNIIALQSNRYSINDEPYHDYDNHVIGEEKAWQFVCNQVNQIAFDMFAVAIVSNITVLLGHHSHIFSEHQLWDKVYKSLRTVQSVLQQQFECAAQVFSQICFKVWVNESKIDRIQQGVLQDLTSKFYSSQNNLHDQNYYENVGRCAQVGQVIEAIAKGQRVIEVIGNISTGKSTILQQICWICQTKNLYKFGVFLFRLSEDKDTNHNTFGDFLSNRDFKSSQNFKTNLSSVLIALDDVDEPFLAQKKNLLKNLRGKAVTILYSTIKKEWGEALQAILESTSGLSINLNTISLNEVYGQVMSHIKLYAATQDHKYSKKIVKQFENKAESIMRAVERTQDEAKLGRALDLLKEMSPKKQEQKITIFLQFYRRNFQSLIKHLQNIKEIKLIIS